MTKQFFVNVNVCYSSVLKNLDPKNLKLLRKIEHKGWLTIVFHKTIKKRFNKLIDLPISNT